MNDFDLKELEEHVFTVTLKDRKREEIFYRAGDVATILGRTNDMLQVLSYSLHEVILLINTYSATGILSYKLSFIIKRLAPCFSANNSIGIKGINNIVSRFSQTSAAIKQGLKQYK